MTGEATPTGRDVSFWGHGSTHWYLDPPLDGHDHVVICDRGGLLRFRRIEGEPEGLDVPTTIPTIVEVFPAKADGTLAGSSMSTLRQPISLTRTRDGIDMNQIFRTLGYDQGGSSA